MMLTITTGRNVHWVMSFTLITVVALSRVFADGIQVRDRDATWIAPPEQAAKLNPLAARPDAVTGGAKVFHQRCAACHRDDGRGTAKAPDLTHPDVQGQSDGALFWKISSGNAHAGMPTFSFLPEPQRWQLVLQVRALMTARPSSD
jgi:mono/diheme cytochrome c family protein